MSVLSSIAEKRRHGLLTQAMFRQFQRFGVHIIPYFVNLTRYSGKPVVDMPGVVFCLMPEKSIGAVAALEMSVGSKLAHPSDRLARGDRCFVVMRGDHILATLWCSFDHADLYGNARPLKGNEAYVYLVFVDPAERGLGLAPFIWLSTAALLANEGVDTFVSSAEVFNRSARRYQTKVGAVASSLHVYARVGPVSFNPRVWVSASPR